MLIFYKVILIFGFVTATNQANILIKYVVFDKFGTKLRKTNFIEEAIIINQQDACDIIVVEELPILQKGMLQINASTRSFIILNAKLTGIEPGVFDEQNITEKIDLSANELTTIPSGIFKNLTIWFLLLSNNKIAYLEKAAISDMPNLKVLGLSGNSITRINVDSFINLPDLATFVISLNKLTILEEKCFDFMAKNSDVHIYADLNNITEIHPNAFDGVINFRSLNLASNGIILIPDNIWSTGPEYLHLQNNQLEELPTSFYNSNIVSVDLTNNPIKCGAQKKLKEFQKNHKLVFEFNDNC